MVCFSQFAMAGTGSCSCMASGMGVAAAASELKKNRLKRTEKRRSGWCSVQTSEPQIWLATSPSMCCCVACRSPGTFVRGPWAHSMRERIRESEPVRWLVSELVWAGWCWFIVRAKHCWLTSLGWLKPTSEQSVWWSNEAGKIRGKLQPNSFKLVW